MVSTASVRVSRSSNRTWRRCTNGCTGSSSMVRHVAYPSVPYEFGNAWNSAESGPSGSAMTTSPVPVRTSRLSTDSCGSPLRKDDDSMPRPVTAPPRVMVFSCGTTSGISPWASVASTRCS